jgi:hypothetical protein
MAIDPSTGLLAWGPNDEDLGTHPVTVRVDDGHGGAAFQTFNVGIVGYPSNFDVTTFYIFGGCTSPGGRTWWWTSTGRLRCHTRSVRRYPRRRTA